MPKSISVSFNAIQNEPAAKAAARIVVSKDNYVQLTGGLESGRLCLIENTPKPGETTVRRQAILWPSSEPMKKTQARISKAFRDTFPNGATGDWLIIVDGSEIKVADSVVVEDITDREGLAPLPSDQLSVWASLLEDQLDIAETVFSGMIVRDVYHRRTRRTFRIREIDGELEDVARFAVDKTQVIFSSTTRTPAPPLAAAATTTKTALPLRMAAGSPAASPARRTPAKAAQQSPAPKPAPVPFPLVMPSKPPPGPPKAIELTSVEGLEGVVENLNRFLSRFGPGATPTGNGVSRAVVLQGDEGTGKTLLLDRVVAAAGWGEAHRIRPSDKLSAIQETFQKALEQRPCVVTLDDIHKLLVEERSNRAAVIQALCDFLDQQQQQQQQHAVGQGNGVHVKATEDLGTDPRPQQQPQQPQQDGRSSQAPQILVLATCLDYQKDIPSDLRLPGRLDRVVPIPFPDPAGRRAILRSFNMPLPPDKAESMLLHWSQQTHAFNGHDLWRLFDIATEIRQRKEILQRQTLEETVAREWPPLGPRPRLANEDFAAAKLEVGPTRMENVDVKPRPVYWHQIHGQPKLVEALKAGVEMINHPERYRGYIDPFPRGYLLYGPPGCSKTMAAQALATESGLNYFAVKGGELLNQYVGETERGIRDLFARAKRASPAVVFLDEIDALAGRRSDFGDKSAASGRGPQMVPALLSEMDGFEPLSKVMVVAATNRPEALDPALLRTGRFDRHFYVPPPDDAARRAILASWAEGMKIDPDFSLDYLATWTDQFSGAEILGMCQTVGYDTKMAFDAGQGPELITTDAFDAVIRKTTRTITKAMLEHFEKWSPSFQ